MELNKDEDVLSRIEFRVADRTTAEALWLELRQLARRCRIDIVECRIQTAREENRGSSS